MRPQGMGSPMERRVIVSSHVALLFRLAIGRFCCHAIKYKFNQVGSTTATRGRARLAICIALSDLQNWRMREREVKWSEMGVSSPHPR